MKRDDDPRITDLRAYRREKQRARERARRTPPPGQPPQGFLGSRPRAGLILVAVVVVMLALWLLPALL